MKKCNYADKYKATRPPTCGCDSCEAKWKESIEALEIELYAETITVSKFELKELLHHVHTALTLLGLLDKSTLAKDTAKEVDTYIKKKLK